MADGNKNQQYEAGQELVPGYTLVQVLGSGMEGEVWRAKAAGGTSVAVKVVRSLSRVGGRKQLKALRTLREIRHTNLCPLHCFWTKDEEGRLLEEGEFDAIAPESTHESLDFDGMGTLQIQLSPEEQTHPSFEEDSPEAEELILVMGLGDCTLHDRLVEVRRKAGLSIDNEEDQKVSAGLGAEETVHYLRGAASAIDTLNQQHNLFHCDIKPQNILVVGGGAQVCDFGLASKVSGDLTRTQSVMFATLAYAAPEVLRKKYSRSVDQYSLATTYFELRTGLLPFDVTTEADVTMAKCTGKLDFTKVSKAERKVLAKAMSVDPEARYENCTEFVDAIAIAANVDTKPIPWKSIVASACLLIALTAAAVWYFAGGEVDGVSSSKLLADAQAKIKKFDLGIAKEADDTLKSFYFRSLGPLRDGLEDYRSAYEGTNDTRLLDTIRAEAATAFDKLMGKVNGDLLAGGHGRNNNNRIRKDLDQLVAALRLEGFVPSSDDRMRTVLIAQIQVDLLDDVPARKPIVKELRQSISGPKKVIEAVVIALGHQSAAKDSEPLTQSTDVLADIADATRLVQEQGRSDLPQWCDRKYSNLEEAMIPELTIALELPSTDPAVLAIIKEHWPNLSADARLNEVKIAAQQGRWEEFRRSSRQLSENMNASADPSLQARITLFDLMRQALDAPSESVELFSAINRSIQNDAALRLFIRSTLPSWIGGVGQQGMDTGAFVGDVEGLFQEIVSMTRIQAGSPQGVPQAMQTWLLLSAVNTGPPFLENTSRLARDVARSHSDSLNQSLGILVELESELVGLNAGRLGSDHPMVDRAKGFVEEVQWRTKVSGLLSEQRMRHIDAIIAFHSEQTQRAAKIWSKLARSNSRGSDSEFREQLGRGRCRLIGDALLAHITKHAGVRDNQVLERRFIDFDDLKSTRQVLEQAKWWIRDLPSGDKVHDRYETQKFLLALATSKPGTSPYIDPALRTHLTPAIAKGQAVPSDGQLYRGTFELALTKRNVSFTLQTAIAMLDIGLADDTLQDPRWITSVLDPTMDLAMSKLSVARSIPSFVRFCEYYLRIDDSIAMEKLTRNSNAGGGSALGLSDRLKGLEIAATVVADNSENPQQSLSAWLKACDLMIRRIELGGSNWSRQSLGLLESYVSKAEAIEKDEPRVLLCRAYGSFQQALLESRFSTRVSLLRDAERSYSEAFSILESLGNKSDPMLLYEGYWRHANCLVSLAIEQSDIKQKTKSLKNGYASAKKAIRLLRRFGYESSSSSHKAYLALGNCCEDLAYYCFATKFKTAEPYYEEAIEAFTKAKEKTSLGNSFVPRYYLARCNYRYHKRGGRIGLLAVRDDMGEFQSDAPASAKVEWLMWRALISLKIDEKEQALTDLLLANEILDSVDELNNLRLNGEVRWLLADVYYQSGADRQLNLGLEILEDHSKDFVGQTIWKGIETEILTLKKLERDRETLRVLKRVSQEMVGDGISLSHDLTLNSLVAVFEATRQQAERNQPGVANQPIPNYVQNVRRELGRIVRLIENSLRATPKPGSSIYVDILKACETSLGDQPLGLKVDAYLNALPAELVPPGSGIDRVLLFDARCAMLNQMQLFFERNQNDENRAIINAISQIKPVDRQRVHDQITFMLNDGQAENLPRDMITNVENAFRGIPAK